MEISVNRIGEVKNPGKKSDAYGNSCLQNKKERESTHEVGL